MASAGQIIAGRYRLERPLGAGAMGSVWAAMHLELEAPIAIKFVQPTAEPAQRARASRWEARAAARLRSPHVVKTFDFGTDDGVAFIAMELLVGEVLKARLDREVRLAPSVAADVVRQTASALEVAHRERIVHRDIKPSNLFMAREADHEIVKVLDFGIAKWLDADAEGVVATESARLVGSAAYMSPEQARGQSIDHRSDVWSLAVVAYEVLLGTRPFVGSNIPDTLRQICAGSYCRPSASLGTEYAELDAVFARGLHLNVERRFQSASEFSRAFDRAVAQLPETLAPNPALQCESRAALGRSEETASLRGTATQVGGSRRARLRVGAAVVLGAAGVFAASLWLVRAFDAPDSTPSRSAPPPETPSLGTPSVVLTASAAPPALVQGPSGDQDAAPAPPRAPPTPPRALPRANVPVTKAPSASPRASSSHVDPLFGLEVPSP